MKYRKSKLHNNVDCVLYIRPPRWMG